MLRYLLCCFWSGCFFNQRKKHSLTSYVVNLKYVLSSGFCSSNVLKNKIYIQPVRNLNVVSFVNYVFLHNTFSIVVSLFYDTYFCGILSMLLLRCWSSCWDSDCEVGCMLLRCSDLGCGVGRADGADERAWGCLLVWW